MDSALFAKIKAGDERAFESLFRERYAAMIAEATPLLHGDGAAAARGIEKIFTQLWIGHDEFESADALEAYLREAVHEAAARINSRHIVAHQLASHESASARKAVTKPAPSVDEAWGTVNNALHPSATRAAEAAHEMAVHSRHEAAGQLAEIAKPRSVWPFIGIGVVLVIAVGAFMMYANRGREATELTAALAMADTRTSVTNMGEFNKVSLGDGSGVNLGPDSKLRIPRTFGVAVRGVQLEGTAVFTVASGQTGKFIVRAGNTTITATGTEFTVRAYADERNVSVRVREGNVTVTVGDSVHALGPGAALAIAKDGATHTPTAAEIEETTGWTDGTVVAVDRPVRDIITLAKRWFGVQLFVTDSTLLDRKVTVRAKIGASEVAIASIEKTGGIKRVWQGTNMVLTKAK